MWEEKRIPIELIDIPEVRASSYMDEEQRRILEASIKRFGLIQPIIVRKKEDGRYELIAGKNRLEEFKKMGFKTITAVVLEASEKDALILHLAENLARGKTDPIEEAKVLKKALDLGMSIEELAKMLGHSVQWVKDRLILLELPEVYQKAISEGKLKIGHIKEALRLPTPEEIAHALDTAMNLRWNIETLKYYVDRRLEELTPAIESGDFSNLPPPPSPEKAQQMVQTRQCLICGRMVDAKKIYIMPMCQDCYYLVKYIVSYLGEPKKAMNTVYQALQHYFNFLQMQQQYMIQQQQMATMLKPPQTPQQFIQTQPQAPTGSEGLPQESKEEKQ